MHKIDLNGKTILVTGAAGFIGSNLVKRLFEDVKGATIIGIDNMNDYYDVRLKEYRLQELDKSQRSKADNKWIFIKGDIADRKAIDDIFEKYKPQIVVNLAAQAGVRYSITNPDAYMLRHRQSMAETRRCLSRRMTVWITPFRFMRLPRRATNSLLIATRNSTTFLLQDSVSSRFMGLQEGLTWRTSVSQTSY